MKHISLSLLAAAAVAQAAIAQAAVAAAANNSFGTEVQFLKSHVPVVVLHDSSGGGEVAVAPGYQGRVMTSTAGGDSGPSYGWLNHELIASGKFQKHFNAFGGEDRFWLGPEGGQFGLFFAKGVPYDLEHWFTPAAVDTLLFKMVGHTSTTARFRQPISLANYSGTKFDLVVDREVRLVPRSAVWNDLGLKPSGGVKMVAYETNNRITNTGKTSWKKATGLLSIWILGQFNPGPTATIVIPIRHSDNPKAFVNDRYFGKVPADRLVIRPDVIFFRADGKYRSKIGISPAGAKPILGSYDSAAHVLTLVQLTLPKGANGYVNSMWELQKQPYGGDAVNSYNDGPPKPGAKPLGPFYELETSSPAAALAPGASMFHNHRTIHIQGSDAALNRIARATLGVSLAQITNAFSGK